MRNKKGGYQILDLTYINSDGELSLDECLKLYNQCLELKNVNKPILCYLEDNINPIFNVDIELEKDDEDPDDILYYVRIYHNGHMVFYASTEDLSSLKSGQFDDYYSYAIATISINHDGGDTLSLCFANMIRNSDAKKLYNESVTTLSEFLSIFGNRFVSLDDSANDLGRGTGKITSNKISFVGQTNKYILVPETFAIVDVDLSLYK